MEEGILKTFKNNQQFKYNTLSQGIQIIEVRKYLPVVKLTKSNKGKKTLKMLSLGINEYNQRPNSGNITSNVNKFIQKDIKKSIFKFASNKFNNIWCKK